MGTLRSVTLLLGIVFLVLGIGAYVPLLAKDGMVFGFFAVDTMHNIIHLVVGAIGVYACTREDYAKLFYRVFGVIFAVIAILGFWKGADLYMIHPNSADNFFHLIVGIVGLYYGYYFNKKTE